jgi:hypothetical protein
LKKEIWYSFVPPAAEKFPMWASMMETDDLFMHPGKVKRCEGRLWITGIIKSVMQEQRLTFNTKDLGGEFLFMIITFWIAKS